MVCVGVCVLGVCVRVCVCVLVCVRVVVCGTLKTPVCAFNTSPCVRSKCPRVYRQHAHMFFFILGVGKCGQLRSDFVRLRICPSTVERLC